MKPIEKLAGAFFLIIVVLSVLYGKSCNKPKEEKIIFVDSSQVKQLNEKLADYEAAADHYASLTLKQADSIEYFRKALKSAKSKFYPKYREILKDSLITDSNCLLTLGYANQTLMQYDSLMGVTSRSLDSCFKFSAEQSGTIKYLKDFASVAGKDKATLITELSRFKHWFWRVYWKRKN